MEPEEPIWFGNAGDGGPSLEDFLATDPSQLPFLQHTQGTATTHNQDTLRYQIFADNWDSIDKLRQLRESILQLADSVTSGYIWHHDPFALSIKLPTDGGQEPFLEGLQVVGESTADEWLVCYLLFTMTKTFDELTACVTDSDGEFLLIEAATAIPPFLSPANSQHRVWIRSGELHLVMPGCMVDRGRTPRTLGSGKITQIEGLKAVREGEGATTADEGVQRLIRRRIGTYPDKAKADMHHARCFLPLGVAAVLRHSPGLVAAAVHASCSGDPTARKAGVRMARFLPPTTVNPSSVGVSCAGLNDDDRSRSVAPRFVEARIAFTRHLYAQLHQAPVVPAPKKFPQGWGPEGAVPSPTHAKASQLGQKLSMGLEAAYQSSAQSFRRRGGGDVRSEIQPEKWKRFMGRLERHGFFEGELEGSKRHREKAAMAEQFVRDSVLQLEGEEVAAAASEGRQCTVHETIDLVLKDLGHGSSSVFETPTEADDNEDWLQVSQTDLDAMLKEYHHAGISSDPSGSGDNDDGDDGESNDAYSNGRNIAGFSDATTKRESDSKGQIGFEDAVDELDDLVAGMNLFVSDTSAGPEGAEVNAVAGDVQFDVDNFMSLLNGADLRSALDEADDEDGHDDLMPSGDDEDEDLGNDENDDELLEKSSRMPESARPTITPAEKSARSDGRSAADVTNSGRAKSNGHEEESKAWFEMLPSEEPDSDDEIDAAGAELSTNGVERNDGDTMNGKPSGPDSFLKEYMAAMDAELDPSSLGQSFEKVGEFFSEKDMDKLRAMGPLDQNEPPAVEPWLPNDAESVSAAGGDEDLDTSGKNADGAEDYKPVDVDMTMVRNLLESTTAQGGLSGPASNLLRSMGLSFPSMPVGSGRGEPKKA